MGIISKNSLKDLDCWKHAQQYDLKIARNDQKTKQHGKEKE